MGVIKVIASLLYGFSLRIPIYILPFALFVTEYVVKNSLKVEFSIELLPVVIMSAALGLVSSSVVLDIPHSLLVSLSAIKQKTLRITSVVAFVAFILGVPLFAQLLVDTLAGAKISLLPALVTDPLGIKMSVQLTWAGLFYIFSLILNELKTGVSS